MLEKNDCPVKLKNRKTCKRRIERELAFYFFFQKYFIDFAGG